MMFDYANITFIVIGIVLELTVHCFTGADVGVDVGATIITAVISGATGFGGDLGNKPIPTSNNTDNPMNNNSYLAL